MWIHVRNTCKITGFFTTCVVHNTNRLTLIKTQTERIQCRFCIRRRTVSGSLYNTAKCNFRAPPHQTFNEMQRQNFMEAMRHYWRTEYLHPAKMDLSKEKLLEHSLITRYLKNRRVVLNIQILATKHISI